MHNRLLLSILITFRVCLGAVPSLHPIPPSLTRRSPVATPFRGPSTEDPGTLAKRGVLTCPETIGGSLYACSADLCGGEDPAKAGHCKKLECKCNGKAETSTPILTTITTGSVTGVFALETISSYSDLRQSITTTVTSTTTSSDGTTNVETAVAVVAAGGVTWFLAAVEGDTAAAETILEPPSPPEDGHEDDPKCPNPESKCSDCTGVGSMCTTGSNAGCACKDKACPTTNSKCSDCNGKDGKCTAGENKDCDCEESCPTGDKQPKCSDNKCKGNDKNKCTVDNKDCDCKPDEECPDDEDTPLCDECGGKDGYCELGSGDNKDKSCYCMSSKNFPPSIVPDSPSVQETLDAIKALPDCSSDMYSVDPAPYPICQKDKLSAPQHGGKPSVQDSIKEWCASVDGKKVQTKSDGTAGTVFEMFPVAYYSFWLSANNWQKAPENHKCIEEATIKKDECIDALTTAMKYCDPKSDSSHGGSYSTGCLSYNITLDSGQNQYSPPWAPLSVGDQIGQCDARQSSGVSYKFWRGIYPKFCAEVDKDPKAKKSIQYTQDDFEEPKSEKARSLMRFMPRTPPLDPNIYQKKYGQDYLFDFEFTGEDGDCRGSCSDAMATITSTCGHTSASQDKMALSATFNAGCGTYSIKVTPPDPDQVFCGFHDTSIDPKYLSNYSTSDIDSKAIDSFCSDPYARVSNPPERMPFLNGLFEEKKSPWPHRYYRSKSADGGDTAVELYATFADQTMTGDLECEAGDDQQFMVKDYEERCKEILKKAVSGCSKDSATEKESSLVLEHEGENGCVVWGVVATKYEEEGSGR